MATRPTRSVPARPPPPPVPARPARTSDVVSEPLMEDPTKRSGPSRVQIAIIVIAIIAAIFFIIAIILLFNAANSEEDSVRNQLNGAGALITIAFILAIVWFIIGIQAISRRRNKGKEAARGFTIAFVVITIVTALLLLIGIILTFTADVGDDQRTNVQGAGALAIIGSILVVVIFFIVILYNPPLPSAKALAREGRFTRRYL